MIGKTISHYKILEKLGAGGMGEVYLAEDTELDRKVALKFLPPQYTEDQEINARFKREAKAAAALNHPNIITIHEIGEHEGKAFIAMEYMAGQSLKDVLSGQELSINKTIDIASQVCEGLNEAHQAGIVHRDIKPDNILIDAKGRVKIADFGLAKAHGRTKLTEEGSTLGTLHYMSPEQLSGADVDRRSDIWSVGVVLYEMITGRLPFEGEYDAAVSYSIMHEKPEPLARYKTGVLEGLQRIIDKALDKDLDTRYQGINDLLADLKRERKSSLMSVKPISKVKKSTSIRTAFTVAGFAIVFAFIAFIAIEKLKKEPAKQVLATHKQLTFTGKAFMPAISPDGKYMAYLYFDSDANGKVMVQDLSGGQALEVFSGILQVGDEFLHETLLWSPDGSQLLLHTYTAGGSLDSYLIPRLGGDVRRIWTGVIASWAPDGADIASTWLNQRQIWFTNKATGDTSSISLARDFVWLFDIDWSPADDRLLFLTVNKDEQYAIWTIKTDGSQQQKLVEDSFELFSPRWSVQGNAIYYFRSRAQTMDLMKIKVVSATGKLDKRPQLLQTGLQAGKSFTLSKDSKRLLYTRHLKYANLWLVELEGAGETQSMQTTQLTTGTSFIDWPDISPDGKWVAFSIGARPQANIFVMPITGGQKKQLTFFNSYNGGPVWSPDGKEIAFGSTQGGKPKVWRVRSNGGTLRPFADSELSGDAFFLSWSPGPNILYERPGNRNFHILNPRTEEERPLVANDSVGWMFEPRTSHDGKSVVVYWNRNVDGGLWLISLQDSSQTLLRKGTLYAIEWSADGNWLYAFNFVEKPIKILKIPASGGEPETLVTLPFENVTEVGISITPDGKRIVCAVVETQSDVWVMENFDPEVK